jgi:GAF domain-containing protein
MRRRDKTGGKEGKTQRPKTLKRHNAPKTARRRNFSAAGPQEQISALARELKEALEQQTATSEVLKVISSSPGELEPVFSTMLENAVRICGAKFGNLMLREGDGFRVGATHGAPRAYVDYLRNEHVFRTNPGLAQLVETKEHYHLVDIAAAQTFGDKLREATVNLAGARTLIGVPMLNDGKVSGAIIIYRQEVRPFTDKQIELVKNFAAQAVIAIENARLLNELRQRTDDLSESLEQQTATSDVLKVISSSPAELEPVFRTMLENATRICGAKFGNLFLREGDGYRVVAVHGEPAYVDYWRRAPVILLRDIIGTPLYRCTESKQTVEISDVTVDPSYVARNIHIVALVEKAGARSFVQVPMIKDDEVLGTIAVYRQEIRPFTEKQIELVENFAAQAVIAIENTRLLNELRESLEQQTATSEVLKTISSSVGELEPIFSTMLENAIRICGAKFGTLFLREGDAARVVAQFRSPPAYADQWRREPTITLGEGALGRTARTKQAVQIADVRMDPAYVNDPRRLAILESAGARTLIVVPMLKNDEVVGQIAIYRQEVLPFTEKQIAVVKNFAAQAVIAIENTRLLNELRESLQQQTATADVLKVISRSTFDLHTVLQTLVESAARLCDAKKSMITREKNGVFYRAEACGFSQEFMDYVKDTPIEMERGSAFGRALLERRVVHIPDVRIDPEYTQLDHQRLGDYRTVLAVPMLREDASIGVLILSRSEVRPFTEKQIELATTFADQAAIAIENVRLFEGVEARTRELAASLEELRTTQDRLVQTQKLALLGQLTAGIAHEIKNPLNFVNNFSGISAELIDELRNTLKGVSLDEKTRAEIEELADTLKGNFDKVVHHGKRADAIVKSMLQHSREGSGEHRVIDINALVEESLNLAWHGARAETQSFEIKLKQSFDPSAGGADVFPQDIRRALLNLISNGFYAATKRRAQTIGGDYNPTLTASTKNLGNHVEIRIRDNGNGITSDVKEKMFEPFFTTKPTGEGTGLGLSISHDIIVKQHGGSIEVDTRPGEFTEIRIILPRVAAFV